MGRSDYIQLHAACNIAHGGVVCDMCCAAVWEMYYCEAAYEGLMEAQICLGVCDGSLRPQFNETCPLAYQKLASQCWAQDPEER